MSWQKVKLGQFLKNREGRYKPNDKAIQGLKRIDKINFSGTIFLSDKPSNTDMILVKKGDLVISGINVEKGAMNIYHGEEDVVATIHYSSYEFDEEKIDIDFLTNFLKSLEFKKALKEQVPGGIKTEIKPKHILPLIVEIPTDVKEQKRIVKKLIENNIIIENASSELTHQLDLIKQFRQAFLREAMQGKLVKSTNTKETGQQLLAKIKAEKAKLIAEKKLKKEKEFTPISEDEIPFEIPVHWAWCRLGDLVTILGDGLHGTPSYTKDGKYHFINGNNLINGKVEIKETTKHVSFEEFQKYKKPMNSNTVLVSINGTLGNLAFFDNEKIILGKSACFFNLFNQLSKYYIGHLIKSQYFLKYAVEVASETTIKNVSLKSMREFPIPLPPLHVQEQIVAKLEELIAFCDGLEQSIKVSQGYNEMLLQQVLREALRKDPVGLV